MADPTGRAALLARFLDLMQEIRLALKAGDLDRLPDLTQRQQALSEALQALPPSGPADTARMEQLARAAARNAVLLKAAGRGIAAAGRRHRERLNMLAGVRTYDRDGRAQPLAASGHSLPALNRRS
ncbi:MAG: flagellar protein FlgN [Rhodobacteraceae bacterium]|nr:flagellar protein FlgN [Paracoccaceae bacterium]